MALPAQWHVHILAPDQVLVVLAGRAECKTGILLAELANGCRFSDLLTLGNQGQDVWEGTAMEGTLQARNHDNLAKVRCLLRKLDYVREKLAFINANDIEVLPLVTQVLKLVNRGRWLLLATMGRDSKVATIAEIGGKFDS